MVVFLHCSSDRFSIFFAFELTENTSFRFYQTKLLEKTVQTAYFLKQTSTIAFQILMVVPTESVFERCDYKLRTSTGEIQLQ